MTRRRPRLPAYLATPLAWGYQPVVTSKPEPDPDDIDGRNDKVKLSDGRKSLYGAGIGREPRRSWRPARTPDFGLYVLGTLVGPDPYTGGPVDIPPSAGYLCTASPGGSAKQSRRAPERPNPPLSAHDRVPGPEKRAAGE